MGVTIASALRQSIPDVDVHVCLDTDHDPPNAATLDVLVANTFPSGLLGRCPRLRWLQLTGGGSEHVPAGDPGVGLVVTHAGDVAARAVAEFAWMALLALAKDAPELVRQQARRVWAAPAARRIAGSHLVLLGLGNVGAEIARLARAFDVRVTAVTRRGRPSPLVERSVTPDALVEIARDADHLIIAVPSQPDTRRLVADPVVRALPEHAVIINLARGSILDTDAVVAALRERRLRAALLDVHEVEPLPVDSPLWATEGLWVTPHCAYAHPGEAEELAALIIDNLTRFRAGAPLRNLVAGHGALAPERGTDSA